MLPDAMLDVNLFRLVTRKGHVHACQHAVLESVLPLELIEEIVGELPIAEEQPVASTGCRGAALLYECPERGDAGARSDHDDVALRRRQCEMPVRPKLDAHPIAACEPLGDMVRGDAPADAAVAWVAHGGDQKMGFVANVTTRRCDRIGARRQRSGEGAQMPGCEFDGKIGDEV